MANLTHLRLFAREIFDQALRTIDPGDAVRRALRLEDADKLGACLSVSVNNSGSAYSYRLDRSIYAIAIGKAAGKMISGLAEVLGPKLSGAVVSTNDPGYLDIDDLDCEIFEGGHPEPNEESLAAAQAAFSLLGRGDKEGAMVFFLLSGGGSAMIEWPISEDVTLPDLRMANEALVKSGAPIGEINAVRRAFSAIKGGRLASRATHCDQITLIVSDVPSGQEWNVASGPTLSRSEGAPKARDVIDNYLLSSKLPESILRAIDAEHQASSAENSTNLREHFVLLSNDDAVEAAASAALRRGFTTHIARDISDEAIESGCEKLIERLAVSASAEAAMSAEHCLISGGEFSCPVKGAGMGGRNLETALRLAIAGANMQGFVALCAGTDGIDGNSPAAGAIVDNTTCERAKKIGLDPQDFLDRSDAYSFFVAIGDAITTGPTGTNVRDLRILLQSNERKPI